MSDSNEQISVRIKLHPDVFEAYELIAALRDIQVEDAIAQHLSETSNFTAKTPIYLDDEARAKVQQLLGAKVSTSEALIDAIKRLTSWNLGGYRIKLPISVLQQVEGYAKTLGKPAKEAVPELVVNALREKFRA